MPFDNRDLNGSTNRAGFVASVDQYDQAKSELRVWYVLAASAVQRSLTGTLAETLLDTIKIPGGMLGPDGLIRVHSLWSAAANNANAKTGFLRLSGATGVSGTYVGAVGVANALAFQALHRIANRASEALQVFGAGSSSTGGQLGASTVALSTGVIDTSVDSWLNITAALASAGDTMALESYVIEVSPS